MAKTKGTRHHVVIKLEDLNKMFKPSDVIAVPKGFVKRIEFLLAAHNVSLEEICKDTADAPVLAASTENESEKKVEFQTTNFDE